MDQQTPIVKENYFAQDGPPAKPVYSDTDPKPEMPVDLPQKPPEPISPISPLPPTSSLPATDLPESPPTPIPQTPPPVTFDRFVPPKVDAPGTGLKSGAGVLSTTSGGSKKKLLFIFLGIAAVVGLALLIYFVFAKGKVTGQKITLTYWGLFEPDQVFMQTISDYEKEHPNIKIDYKFSKLTEYRQRLQTALKSEESPDIFRIHQSWIPMFGGDLSAIPSDIYDKSTFEKTFYPSAKESLKYQSEYVAIPLEVDGLALFYNEDIFKAAGENPPKYWTQVSTLAKKLTQRPSGKIVTAGIALGTTNNVDHWSDILGMMLLQSGVDPSDPAVCNESSNLNERDCPGAAALSYYTRFMKVDRVWDETMPSSTFAFATGSLAMYFGPSWRVFDIENLKRDYKSTVNYKIIPVPQLQDDTEGGNISWSSYWVEAVSKNSKHQTEAWEFLKYLSSKEVLQKLYQTQGNLRKFGEPFPRTDMADLLKTEPLAGSFIQQAPYAKNWYLSSNTEDEGINKQIIKYYEDAVNAVNQGEDPVTALTTTAQGVKQVLRQYGLAQ